MLFKVYFVYCGDALASLLVLPSPDRARGLCSWVKHVTLTVPLSAQVYKWVGEFNAEGNSAMD